MHVFMGGPDPDSEEHELVPTTTEDTTNVFHVLVSKLQESLNRKESFEVVTPYQGPIDGELCHPNTVIRYEPAITSFSFSFFQICVETPQEC
jgi:hypothetical protein